MSEDLMIPDQLQELIGVIMEGGLSDDEWLSLEEKTTEYLGSLSIDLQDYFVESGAGETLEMICTGIRFCTEQCR